MKKIDTYHLIEKIDETQTTEVHRARQDSATETVIIKVLKTINPSLSEIARFKQEYDLIRRIACQGIVGIYDIIEYSGKFALVLEDFNGIPLNTVFPRKPIPLDIFLKIAIAVADTLGHLHRQNIIHMDIKPRNILVNPENYQVKISDFGISAQITNENEEIYDPMVVKGTLAYISPEQAGRINQHPDHRTDLYSLGITFYELLTGTLPYISTDPLELIHSHIAKKPIPPHYLNPEIPEVVSDIILKLMSKNAEERYQNSFGLMTDLEKCLNCLDKNEEIPTFPLGGNDIALTLTIPKKLYGREQEVDTLLTGFHQASQGKAGIVLVSGFPGIGKTALINEIQNPILARKGYFISGKYEQSRRDVPYSAIIQAFQQLIKKLLFEKKEMIAEWKEKLIRAVSPYENLILEIIPDLSFIIGSHENKIEIEKLKNRIPLVFKKFIKTFAEESHPLVLFFDDLQWADLSSLQLLRALLSDADMEYLYIIASYRNNEIVHGHPLGFLIQDIKKQTIQVQEILLTPLEPDDVNDFLVDILKCTKNECSPLADLVFKKTGGNPFFINQFVKNLYDRKLLLNDEHGGYRWDIDEIRQMALTENVVVFLSNKIEQLTENIRRILKAGACIGNTFDLERLSVVLNTPMETLWNDVKYAIQEGYLELFEDVLRFQHDRIREAAYQLVPEPERKKIHYQIGRYTLEKTSADELPKHIFYIVDHLNHAIDLITKQEEQEDLARLNLVAGEKALYSAAYTSAQTYLGYGISLLGENGWTTHYDLSLELYKAIVAATCLEGRFAIMDNYLDIAWQNIRNLPDQVPFYEFQISAQIAQNHLADALKTGLGVLKKLGITFPEKPNIFHILLGFIRVKIALAGKKPEDLLHLPEMHDPKSLRIMRIITKVSAPAYQLNMNLSMLIEFMQLRLSVRYGNTPDSSVAYSTYGLFLCGIMKDFHTGYKFGMLGLNLLDKLQDTAFKAQALTTFHGFIKHWKDPMKDSMPDLLEGFYLGKEAGSMLYAAYCLFIYCGYAFWISRPLNLLDEELTTHLHAVDKIRQVHPHNYIKIIQQVVQNLKGDTDDPCHLKGGIYNEDEMLPIHETAGDQSSLVFVYAHKMFLNYLFGDLKNAYANAVLTKKHFKGSLSSINDGRYYLLSPLINLALYPTANYLRKSMILIQVANSRKKLKKYAELCPENLLFAFYLLEAEYCKTFNKHKQAIMYYDKAITATRENGFIQFEALANELTSKFFLDNGHANLAVPYMRKAASKYKQWGAHAKVRQLNELYPDFFINTPVGNHNIPDANTSASTTSILYAAKGFDLSTIVKASEAIFGEIALSSLLKRLMGIIIENAGAEKGFIILQNEDTLMIEAEGNIENQETVILKSIPIEQHQGLSASIVNYTARLKKSVILNNASVQGDFAGDTYITENKPKSVLCMPILNQGRLSAVLYLENNLATNVFTSERLEILNLLSSQIAVAIDNARLYETMEQKVEKRTAQLKQAQEENLKKAHRAGMADIAKETLHNMGNVLTSIKTTADNMNYHTQESALNSLISANNLLKKHMDNIEDFILKNPKGKMLLTYYTALENMFLNERHRSDQQLKRLREKVDDIVNVVNTLQSHIGSDDTYLANVRLMEEVRFILSTKRDGLARSNIKIKESYDDTPMVKVQKAKLAHILDNLIVNAKEAMEETSFGEKVMYVDIEHKDRKVLLHISDNGEGISEENIRKIFFYGFTTKEGRSGHNLHNCANNMTEMGGKIYAESKGRGQGAKFTLEFPIS